MVERLRADGLIVDGERTSSVEKPGVGLSQVGNDVIDLFLAGEPVDAVAAEFGLSRAEVEDVLRASARPAA